MSQFDEQLKESTETLQYQIQTTIKSTMDDMVAEAKERKYGKKNEEENPDDNEGENGDGDEGDGKDPEHEQPEGEE